MLDPSATLSNNLQFVGLLTQADALSSLSVIDAAFERIAKQTGNLGSAMSRIQAALGTLSGRTENLSAAAGRIENADVADEAAAMIRTQILQQVGSAVLASASQQPQIALGLLKEINTPREARFG